MSKLVNSMLVFAITLAFIIVPYPPIGPTEAHAARGDRTLWLHFTHTGEEKKITFRRNGKYDPKGIKELQWIVRDWRRNEAAKMDPRLFDLIWSVYQEAGATKAIRVVSGYRSKKTNDKLRRRSRGVAKTSQHTAGRAMDFFIPGVPVKKLREIGLKMQVGGVGYYPGSRTPFVHMDTGSVRHWPRMTPKQVAALFPDGKTLHRDTRGRHGRQYAKALAEYEARKSKIIQPLSKSKRTRFASNKTSDKNKKKSGGILASLFKGSKKDKKPTTVAAATPQKAPAKTPKIIANKTTPATEAAPIPSRIGRAAPIPAPDITAPTVKPTTPTVVALAPTPRALPNGLRDQFVPEKSIVVAEALIPLERPNRAPQTPEDAAPQAPTPQIIVAKATIPEEENLPQPAAIDPIRTAALSRSDFNVPTPKIVKNRLESAKIAKIEQAPAQKPIPADPTRLVLNDKLTKPVKPTLSPTPKSELAYANAADAVESLPQLNANEFNNRFGQASKDKSDVSAVPLKVIKELTAAERFAALEIQEEQPSFSLNDIGIETKEDKLEFRKSLSLLDNDPAVSKAVPKENKPTVVASAEPDALPVVEPSLSVKEPEQNIELPKQAVLNEPLAQKQAQKAQAQDHSLTVDAGSFRFSGERKQIVQTLLTPTSVSHAALGKFALPKPDHVPSLFVQPTRAYAGSFTRPLTRTAAKSFTGDAITLTPTVNFDPASRVRLGWLAN